MKSESFKNSKLALAWVRSQKDARREVQWTSQGCAWRDLGYGSARRTRTLCA